MMSRPKERSLADWLGQGWFDLSLPLGWQCAKHSLATMSPVGPNVSELFWALLPEQWVTTQCEFVREERDLEGTNSLRRRALTRIEQTSSRNGQVMRAFVVCGVLQAVKAVLVA